MRLAIGALTAGYAAMAAFHTALAAGAPFGHAAWGGAEAHLTTGQRIGSAFSAAFFVAALALVRRRAAGRGERRYRWGVWALTVALGLSALANIASDSRWENALLAPAAILLCLLTGAVARSGAVGPVADVRRAGRIQGA